MARGHDSVPRGECGLRLVNWFLLCDVMHSGLSHRISVMSVRPSVTVVDCVHMVRPTIVISVIWQPHDSSFLAQNFVSTLQRHDIQIQGQIQLG